MKTRKATNTLKHVVGCKGNRDSESTRPASMVLEMVHTFTIPPITIQLMTFVQPRAVDALAQWNPLFSHQLHHQLHHP